MRISVSFRAHANIKTAYIMSVKHIRPAGRNWPTEGFYQAREMTWKSVKIILCRVCKKSYLEIAIYRFLCHDFTGLIRLRSNWVVWLVGFFV